MLLITRRVGQEFCVDINGIEVKFVIKRIRGKPGDEKVEIAAIAPKAVKFTFTHGETK